MKRPAPPPVATLVPMSNLAPQTSGRTPIPIRGRLFWSLIAVLVLDTFSFAQRVSAETLTVATYNLENGFDAFDDPYSGDEAMDPKPAAAWAAAAEVVQASDADVVFVQEVENEAALAAWVAAFLPDAGYREVLVVPTNSERGIHLGVLSRVPIDGVTSHRWSTLTHPATPDKRWRFARDLQRVDLRVADAPGGVLHAFHVHLKSNRDAADDPRSMLKRTAEAMELRRHAERLLTERPGAWVLAVGDFNSDPTGEAERPFPAAEALLREPSPLIDVFKGVPRVQRITHPGGRRYPSVVFDLILASPPLAQRVLPERRQVVEPAAGRRGSDHRLVAATFNVAAAD